MLAGFEVTSHDDDPTVCCLVNPIMKRSLRQPSFYDAMFCDTSTTVDRQGTSVTFMLTSSKAG